MAMKVTWIILTWLLFGLLLPFVFSTEDVVPSNKSIIFELKSNQSYFQRLLYDQHYVFNITLESLDVRAVVVYAFSQGSVITLSLDEDFSLESSTHGVSAGTVQLVDGYSAYVLLFAKVRSLKNCSGTAHEDISIVVAELSSQQPIPGGCNLVHDANYYPIVSSKIKDYLWQVNFQPANVGFSFNESEPLCDNAKPLNQRLLYDLYVGFLPFSYKNKTCCTCANICDDPSSNITLQDLSHLIHNRDYGYKLATLKSSDKTQFSLAVNPCLNSVIYVVVRDSQLNVASSYVPSIVLKNELRSNDETPIFMHIILVVLMLCALLLCFTGHRFFVFEIFMFCSLFFGLVSYILFEYFFGPDMYSSIEKIAMAAGVGMFFAFVFVALWWRFGYSRNYCLFISLIGGFLFSSIVFVTPLINMDFFRDYATFVSFFFVGVTIYLTLFVIIPSPKSCIVTSSFVGSYLFVFGLSSGIYLCSEISLAVPLTILRIAHQDFQYAYVAFYLSIIDVAVIVTWLVLCILGCVAQFRLQKSQPDFPECPYKKMRDRQSSNCTIQGSQDSSTDTDSLSVGAPSYTSENYDGDISEGLNGSCESQSSRNEQTGDTAPLLTEA